jgi:hypothetical protein
MVDTDAVRLASGRIAVSAPQALADLPQPVTKLVDVLAAMPGTVAVVLGGSRALGAAASSADWDLGVYYRGTIDLTALAAFGEVYPPGAWGRVMNGGAWLKCADEKVDVILRDLDVVEHWTRRAERGEFEVDALLGYLAGIPTYTLCAELASCNVAGAAAQAAKAVMEQCHAIVCERGQWVCNEKRLIDVAGLVGLHALFTQVPSESASLVSWVDRVADRLGVPKGEATPWR